MNINPAHRFFPSFRSRGFQFGLISRRYLSLLRRLLRRVLYVLLLIQLAQFMPQLHQFAELLESGPSCVARRLGRSRPEVTVMCGGAFLDNDVKPRVPWERDDDVLAKGQVGQLLVSRYGDIRGHSVAE